MLTDSVLSGDQLEPPSIVVSVLCDPTVNYASYQNNVPLIRSLTLTNDSDEPLRDIEVSIRCEPAFAEAMRLRFDRLDAHEVRRIDAIDLKFNHKYLAELTEAERGHVDVVLSIRGIAVAEASHPIDIPAYDEWAAGRRALPELLADHPLVAEGGLGHRVAIVGDPFGALEDLMVVVEALCPVGRSGDCLWSPERCCYEAVSTPCVVVCISLLGIENAHFAPEWLSSYGTIVGRS